MLSGVLEQSHAIYNEELYASEKPPVCYLGDMEGTAKGQKQACG